MFQDRDEIYYGAYVRDMFFQFLLRMQYNDIEGKHIDDPLKNNKKHTSWELTHPFPKHFWVDEFPFPFRWDMWSFPEG